MKRSASEIEAVIDELASHGLGGLAPEREPLRVLLEADRAGPLHFVNLLAYHDRARYPEGYAMAARALSGAQAYALYGAVAVKHVTQRGGRLVAWSDVEQSLIGDAAGWHQIAIMEYPDTEAFIDMIRDPDYIAGLVHRDAGLAKTALLVSRPLLGTKRG